MRIGILKETTFEEKRVSLTPDGVFTLIEQGHQVFVEKDAGLQSRCTDLDYQKIGAKIVYNADEVYGRSEFLIKVAPFSEEESKKLQDEQIVMSFLQLAVKRKYLLEQFLNKKITAIAYELIEDSQGNFPILTSMSEIAGQMAVQIAARYLENHNEGVARGVLMGGTSGVAPASVVILGAGTVGKNATSAALGLGAQVIVLDKDVNRLREIQKIFGKRVTAVVMNPSTIRRGVKYADVLIGAILLKGNRVNHVVSEDMVKLMKPGSVIIDVSIDQGGCVETSRPTTISNPTFIFNNVIHYCVPNIPALVPRTSSYGLKNSSLDYIIDIANSGIDEAIQNNPDLTKGVCTLAGNCTNDYLAEIFNVELKRIHYFSKN